MFKGFKPETGNGLRGYTLNLIFYTIVLPHPCLPALRGTREVFYRLPAGETQSCQEAQALVIDPGRNRAILKCEGTYEGTYEGTMRAWYSEEWQFVTEVVHVVCYIQGIS